MTTRKTRKKYLSLRRMRLVEGVDKGYLKGLQADHGLPVYEINCEPHVEESALHAALDRAKREVRL